jgi:hypothetical protein
MACTLLKDKPLQPTLFVNGIQHTAVWVEGATAGEDGGAIASRSASIGGAGQDAWVAQTAG